MKRHWVNQGCSAWRRDDSRKTLLWSLNTYRGIARNTDEDFLPGHLMTRQRTMILNGKRVPLYRI